MPLYLDIWKKTIKVPIKKKFDMPHLKLDEFYHRISQIINNKYRRQYHINVEYSNSEMKAGNIIHNTATQSETTTRYKI